MKVAKALAAFEQRDYVNERDLTDAVRFPAVVRKLRIWPCLLQTIALCMQTTGLSA
jgi:hypothetical protein